MMSEVLSMRLAPSLRTRLREAAEGLGVSFSEHLRTVIEDDALSPDGDAPATDRVTLELSVPAAVAVIQALEFCFLAYEEQLRRAGSDQGIDAQPGIDTQRARVEAAVGAIAGAADGAPTEDDRASSTLPPDTLRIAPEVKALLRKRAAKRQMPLSTYVARRLTERVAPELAWKAEPRAIALIRLALLAGTDAESLAASDATLDVRPLWARAEAAARRLLGL